MGQENGRDFAIDVARLVSDYKSENVIALDLRGISSVTDFTVIATGTSDRQIRGVSDRVIEFGKNQGQRPYGVSGFEGAQWVVLDFVDVVVHLFSASYREYYDLELLWGDAPRLEWSRNDLHIEST